MNPWTLRKTTWEKDKPLLQFVRKEVFVKEQKVPEELEWDREDNHAWHLLVQDKHDHPIATARILPSGQIGRMAVLEKWRHCGIGSALIKAAIELAQREGIHTAFLHAQHHAMDFYLAHGFIVEGSTFMDAGILHIPMQRQLN